MKTIEEGKAYLRANFEKGCKCPCCDGSVKLYKRKLNSGMALFLIGLYKLTKEANNGSYVSVVFFSNKEIMAKMNINTASLDYSVLKHFNLIDPRASEIGKKDSGHWSITWKGLDFVEKNTTLVPKHVFLYNNKRQGFSDETITIKEALGEKFDFDELMKG